MSSKWRSCPSYSALAFRSSRRGAPRAAAPLARGAIGRGDRQCAISRSTGTWLMRLDIYLNYSGNCQQAFRFYEQHLGGKITMMMTHGLYALLSDGGQIFMKMEKTFFANRFAMLRDRFGTSWMLLQGVPAAGPA